MNRSTSGDVTTLSRWLDGIVTHTVCQIKGTIMKEILYWILTLGYRPKTKAERDLEKRNKQF